MIKHVVLLKFKEGIGQEEKNKLHEKLKALPAKIAEIKAYEMGFDVVRSKRSYDYGLVATFDDMETLKKYQEHPDHVLVLQLVLNICESIIAVDFET